MRRETMPIISTDKLKEYNEAKDGYIGNTGTDTKTGETVTHNLAHAGTRCNIHNMTSTERYPVYFAKTQERLEQELDQAGYRHRRCKICNTTNHVL
jgi:hypothetical protein